MIKEVTSTIMKKSWNIEMVKLMYDYLKHITTLGAGSILILIAFNEKLSSQPSWKFTLKISLVLFIISIISATIALLGVSTLSDPEFVNKGSEEGLWGGSKLITVTFSLTWIAFVLALIALIVFGFKKFVKIFQHGVLIGSMPKKLYELTHKIKKSKKIFRLKSKYHIKENLKRTFLTTRLLQLDNSNFNL